MAGNNTAGHMILAGIANPRQCELIRLTFDIMIKMMIITNITS